MIVYRIIRYEGESARIAEMFRLSIHGDYQPGSLKITAAPVEPRIVESTPMLLHALQQVAGKRWSPPEERGSVGGDKRKSASALAASTGADTEAAEFIQRIDDLLDDGYGWAADTLEGIRETVERTGRVTEGQRTAVDNIENARSRR